ncbi:holo-[acyl-carrier protein] synthase [Conyzicola nivalis]|uniref:Holo-[acyl-carrier-protein] synthase n=1 Tax=Conyzicola nivalis TaxID=1477021 RepID=A0ABV2QNY9_9MICO
MIVGIGVDVVDLARFERALSRTPKLKSRLFADAELVSGERVLALRSLAGRFAAKEALIKALGESAGIRWHHMQIVSDGHGNPSFRLSDAAAQVAADRGVTAVHLSMSHDAGVAIAYVVAEGTS